MICLSTEESAGLVNWEAGGHSRKARPSIHQFGVDGSSKVLLFGKLSARLPIVSTHSEDLCI